jgi:hypothetical protein
MQVLVFVIELSCSPICWTLLGFICTCQTINIFQWSLKTLHLNTSNHHIEKKMWQITNNNSTWSVEITKQPQIFSYHSQILSFSTSRYSSRTDLGQKKSSNGLSKQLDWKKIS